MPPKVATVAPAAIPARAKTKRCIRLRPTFTKNQLVTFGRAQKQKAPSSGRAIHSGMSGSGFVGWIVADPMRSIASPPVSKSSGSRSMTAVAVAKASTVNDRRSATTPADTAALTPRLFASPAALTSG